MAPKLGGILPGRLSYPMDDPPVMVFLALQSCIRTCQAYGVEPVGGFEMSVLTSMTSFAPDEALRWEFTPYNPPTEDK